MGSSTSPAAEPIGDGSLAASASESPPTRAIVLVVANHKGGVAKTTSIANLGAALAAAPLRRRVLLIDADPQANLSEGFGCDAEHPDGLVRLEDALADEFVSLAPTPWSTRAGQDGPVALAGGVHMLPSSELLEEQITTAMSEEAKVHGTRAANAALRAAVPSAAAALGVAPDSLALALSAVHDAEPSGVPMIRRLAALVEHYRPLYDYILIDTPPGLQALPTMALLAADWVIAPSRPSDADIGGAFKLVTLLEETILEHNPSVRFLGVLVNQLGHKWRLGRDVRELLEVHQIPKLQREIPFAANTGDWPRYMSPTVTRQPASRVGIAYRAAATDIDRALYQPAAHPIR